MINHKLPAQYIALDHFGGLQTLYEGFAKEIADRGLSLHTVSRTKLKSHSQFIDFLETGQNELAKPENAIALDFVPKAMRRTRRQIQRHSIHKAINRLALTNVVCWNAPPERYMKSAHREFAFYDHGYSSIRIATKERRRQLSSMAGLICVSQSNKRLLQNEWQYDGAIHVVRNPIRQAIANHRLKPRTIAPNVFHISCAARLVSFKGIASVIHATAILSKCGYPVTLSIAGIGPELEILKETAQKCLPKDSIRFLGLVHDMKSYFDETDIFVAPSLREPFGLSPLEALGSGVPTVLSNIDGHPEVLPFDGAAVLVEPDMPLEKYIKLGSTGSDLPKYAYFPSRDDIAQPRALSPETLADALIHTIEEYPFHAKTAAMAAEQIREEYSMIKYTDKLLRVFRDIF